ncbi:MAG TPA: hypothetical protein VM865_00370 [Acidobacteriaceae bacterium]|nr:hypothetical protein [Acidobacteriaceae bacterium]
MGTKPRDALYRVTYNAVSVVSLLWLWRYIHQMEDRPLYRIPRPWRYLTQGARVYLLGVVVAAAKQVGLGPFSGISELAALGRGEGTEREPEAQGPAGNSATLQTGGPFRYVRHPTNAAATAIVLLAPEMTVVRAVVAVITLLYTVVGSLHEESRLEEAYGEPYREYQRSGVPFLIPRLDWLSGGGCAF